MLRRPFLFLISVLCMVSCTAFEHLEQDVAAVRLTLQRKIGFGGTQPVLVDLSKLEIARIGPSTERVDGIYFSDFVEQKNSNHIRPAARFRHTADTLLGDKMMPLSHFSRFYGIENGRIKTGRLDQFSDSTIVLPVRNCDCQYISRIETEEYGGLSKKLYFRPLIQTLKDRKELSTELLRQVKEGGYSDKKARYRLNGSYIRRQYPLLTYYPGGVKVTVYAPDGSVVNSQTITDGAPGKIFLADSLGNAVFINRLKFLLPEDIERLNAILAAHPLCPVLIDNGRYYQYSVKNGSYREYIRQDLFHPDSCHFVVGSISRQK